MDVCKTGLEQRQKWMELLNWLGGGTGGGGRRAARDMCERAGRRKIKRASRKWTGRERCSRKQITYLVFPGLTAIIRYFI